MRLIERLGVETEAFHAEADEDAIMLLGAVTSADYQRFLLRMYGFVQPLERSLALTPSLESVTDCRRFRKHQLLRSDLEGFRMTAVEIDRQPVCSVPRFETVEEALGWAYVVERSTLPFTSLFRHLASVLPGDVAFTSTYLKCYFGAIGENWKAFGDSLDVVANIPLKAGRMIDAAKAAFLRQRSWRRAHDEHLEAASQRRSPPQQRSA